MKKLFLQAIKEFYCLCFNGEELRRISVLEWTGTSSARFKIEYCDKFGDYHEITLLIPSSDVK